MKPENPTTDVETSGLDLIARHLAKMRHRGYDRSWDLLNNRHGELATVAAVLASPRPLYAVSTQDGRDPELLTPYTCENRVAILSDPWPTNWDWDPRPEVERAGTLGSEVATRVRMLARAGAFIAAELDRYLGIYRRTLSTYDQLSEQQRRDLDRVGMVLRELAQDAYLPPPEVVATRDLGASLDGGPGSAPAAPATAAELPDPWAGRDRPEPAPGQDAAAEHAARHAHQYRELLIDNVVAMMEVVLPAWLSVDLELVRRLPTERLETVLQWLVEAARGNHQPAPADLGRVTLAAPSDLAGPSDLDAPWRLAYVACLKAGSYVDAGSVGEVAHLHAELTAALDGAAEPSLAELAALSRPEREELRHWLDRATDPAAPTLPPFPPTLANVVKPTRVTDPDRFDRLVTGLGVGPGEDNGPRPTAVPTGLPG